MRRSPVAAAFLLAAWLGPLAAQTGAAIHLLDAAKTAHPPSLLGLLVHGHDHGRQVPAHEHSVRETPPAGRTARSPVALPPATAPAGGLQAASPLTAPFPHVGTVLRSGLPRHLLLGVLLI